jgi:hypothetical protein
MPGVAAARLSGLVIVVATALGVLPLAVDAAGGPGCPESTSPQLAASLTDLHQALGDVMGSPSGCPLADADGSTIQATTTGLAVYRPSGMSVFVSGERHWALTAQGLETWTGSWHNGLDPPITLGPDQDQWAAVQSAPAPTGVEAGGPPPASIEALTLVQVRQDASNTIVVEDPQGSMLTIETASDCPDLVAAVGDHVFMRTGGAQTDLVLLQQHEICAVADMRPAEAT